MLGILIDTTLCTGCEKCVDACIEANHLDARKAEYDKAVLKDGLSENRFSSIIQLGENQFAKKACMHCLEPACVQACLVGGMTRTADGVVRYDPDKCIGCRYCMLACPFEIPRYEWSSKVPFVKKCQLCMDNSNSSPACVDVCPNGVMVHDVRDHLLELAHSRIANQPGRYINHVWGETEFGGTAVLYISNFDLGELGWDKKSVKSIPQLAAPMVHATPVIGGSVLASVLGVNWIVQRRMKRMKETERATGSPVRGGNSHD